MRLWSLALLLLCLGCSGVQAEVAAPAQINLVSEQWGGHTNADGSGLARDVMAAVFEPAGIKLNLRIVPYSRSIGLVQRGEADAWLGSYRNEVKQQVFYPQWHYDAERVSALGLASQAVPNLQSIGRFRLAWMHGYEYQHYLPGLDRFQEVQRRSGILDMLERGRADFYIDSRSEVDAVLRGAQTPERFRITQLTRLPLYPGFADTARGRALAAVYDRRMAELVETGSLRPLFQRWQQPYPFDKDMERSDATP